MGSGRWSSDDWASTSASTRTKSVDAVFTTRGGMKDHLNPLNVATRESRDSVDNPQSTAMIVGVDVTGSMGRYAKDIASESMGVLFQEIFDRKPITDPHLMFMGIGDANCDTAPLQVSQFEADNRIIDQLTDIYLESGGGCNQFESYNLPWYFAAMHTSIDCFEKRGKKGYLFTLGDEETPGPLTRAQIKEFIGDDVERDYSSQELLKMAQKTYHVFHVIIEQGSHCRNGNLPKVQGKWKDLMGQYVLSVSDHTKLSEVIVSAIQVIEGADKDAVIASWSGDTSIVVGSAIKDLVPATSTTSKSGVVRL
jgi:hypothetical protein